MPLEKEAESVPDSDEEEALEIEEAPPLYPENVDVDEQRRAFVVEQMANADIAGETLVVNMDLVCKWLATGEVPKPEKPKPHFKTIRNSD